MNNTHLIEFAKKPDHKTNEEKEQEIELARKRHEALQKKKDQNHLVWGNPIFGIHDRYSSGDNWMFSGPGNMEGCPVLGQYF